MNAREWSKYLARDLHCLHCGRDDETLIPHHRINRGSGGAGIHSKRNQPSNVVVMCSAFNTLMESDADAAQEAVARGWKLRSFEDPTMRPVWDAMRCRWMFLDNQYGSFEAYDWPESDV